MSDIENEDPTDDDLDGEPPDGEVLDEDELDDVLFDLLEYCKRDTEAMVQIWQRLQVLSLIHI